ncbi:MAG: peroxiredoxin [Vicingaceae bacterium]|jgi:peroxiredoxin
MRKLSYLLVLASLLIIGNEGKAQKGYSIDITIDGLTDSTAYLAYYYGKGQYYRDTTKISGQGEMNFKGSDTLEHGMYSLIIGQRKWFDFMLDNQTISLKTDTSYTILNMKVKGSEETKIFYEYLAFLNERQATAKKLSEKKKTGTDREKKDADAALKNLDTEVKNYIALFHDRHQGSFTSNFIYAVEYPNVPDTPKNEDGSADSTFAFRYFKAHYFDNYDFTDGRLLRTTTFHDKIVFYVNKLTVPDPDSLIISLDYVLGNAKQNPDLFKYALTHFTSYFERSENMGMDAVFVHLAKNYFMNGKAKEWFTDKQLEKLSERANALDPLLIGKKAPNIVVKDTAQKEFLELYAVEADFTIVYIWSPECGHCKTSTPKLKTLYDKMKDKGVEVFAVGNEFENEEWIKFIKKHDLNFINGSDGETFQSNFRTLYDVYSTPQTYLLDKDKKILSKKMSIESLENILEYFIEERDNSNEK